MDRTLIDSSALEWLASWEVGRISGRSGPDPGATGPGFPPEARFQHLFAPAFTLFLRSLTLASQQPYNSPANFR